MRGPFRPANEVVYGTDVTGRYETSRPVAAAELALWALPFVADARRGAGLGLRTGVGQRAAATRQLVIGRYGTLRLRPNLGQAHHLNQDAVFGSLIPTEEGVAIYLEGNAFTQIGSGHYNAHLSLEGWFNQFRRGGQCAGQVPTNLRYSRALLESLQRAGLTREEALQAVRVSIRQRVRVGQLGGTEVPRVPGRMGQRR